jgi:hypothetical protein
MRRVSSGHRQCDRRCLHICVAKKIPSKDGVPPATRGADNPLTSEPREISGGKRRHLNSAPRSPVHRFVDFDRYTVSVAEIAAIRTQSEFCWMLAQVSRTCFPARRPHISFSHADLTAHRSEAADEACLQSVWQKLPRWHLMHVGNASTSTSSRDVYSKFFQSGTFVWPYYYRIISLDVRSVARLIKTHGVFLARKRESKTS